MRVAKISAAVAMAFSAGAYAAPTITVTAPTSGKTVSGTIIGPGNCAATGSGAARVDFYIDSTKVFTDGTPSNGITCYADTTKFANGSHVFKAVAVDSSGASSTSQVSFYINNGGTTTGGTTTGGTTTGGTTSSSAPTLAWQMPAEGGTLTGNVQGPPNCIVTGNNLVKVAFYLNGVLTNTDGNLSNGLGCWIDTTKYPNGSYTVKAVGYNSAGATVTASRGIKIQNGTTTSTNTAPTVALTTPAAGATLSGTVACAATASDDKGVSRVDFTLGSTAITSDATSPYTCSIDTTKFANGSYNLTAKAVDTNGASATATRTVSVQNSTSQPPATGGAAIDAADIIGAASAATAFSTQKGYSTQVIGTYTSAAQIPESGINGTMLSNGETLRLGKQTDPVNSTRKALTFQLSPSDPTTSGSHRSEISFTPMIEMEKVYWQAFSLFVNDWGTLSSGDSALMGTQLHSGNNTIDLSPAFGLYTSNSGRNMQIQARWSTASPPSASTSTTVRYADRPIPFGRWTDIVIKYRQSVKGTGFMQVWMDGTLVADHQGNLGFNTGVKDYVKFGYYNWSSFSSTRKVHLRAPVIVADPTGSKYKPEDLRAYVNAQ